MIDHYLVETANRAGGRLECRERYAKTERALSAYLHGERLARLFASTSELFPIPHARPREDAA
jgi:hypothetical protein